MPRAALLVTGFNAGEISPELLGRSDLAKYRQGVRRLRNMVVRPEGGAFRRSGTRFVAGVVDPTVRGRLLPYTFSTEAAFLLEFGDQRVRVFSNGGLVAAAARTFVAAGVDTTAEQITITDHGWKDGQGPLRLTTTGTLPAPLVVATDYFVKKPPTISFAAGDITTGTPATITVASHGLSDEMGPFVLHTDGRFPGTAGELRGPRNDDGVLYWLNVTGASTFQLATSKGGASINITLAGTGTHRLVPTDDYMRDTFRLALTAGGAAIDLTSTGGGPDTHTATPTPQQAFEIDSPYLEADLPGIRFAQQSDALYLVHEDYAIRTLRPVDFTAQAWELDELTLIDGPFQSINSGLTTISGSGIANRQTMTLSSIADVNDGKGFEVADIGRFFRVTNGNPATGAVATAMMWGIIIGVQSSTVADIEILRNHNYFPFPATVEWRLGFFRKGNQPRAISFFEQRLALAGEPETSETMHASVTKEFNRFSPTGEAVWTADTFLDVLDDNAIDFFVASNQFNRILWMAFGRSLILGTPGGIFPVLASSNNEAVTPTNINISQATVSGVSDVQAINVGNRVVYTGRANRRVRALRFAFESDDFVADDLTVLANHVLGRSLVASDIGIEEMAYALERDSIVWAVRKDGVLLGLTFVPDQDVFAWHLHEIGGSFQGGRAVVESVSVIPSSDGTRDEIWLIVKRTIGGVTARYVEVVEPNWESGDLQDARFLDSHPEPYSGVPVTVISGLDHLEGETVQIMADEGVVPEQVVSGGQVTLAAAASRIKVGLGFSSEIQSLPLELPDPTGVSAGKQARIDHAIINVLETVGGEQSRDGVTWESISWREGVHPMNQGVPPFTGFRKIAFPGSHTRDKEFWLRQAQPLPFQLLGATILARTGDR
jgi:hypothetical protein